MKRHLFIVGVLSLLITTATYSVVNAAQSILPEQIEQRAACSTRIASFCGTYGNHVCGAIVPQDCGAMQSTSKPAGHTYERGIFYMLTVILLGIAFVEVFRRREKLAVWAGTHAHLNFFPTITSPPLLVGGLSSLRF